AADRNIARGACKLAVFFEQLCRVGALDGRGVPLSVQFVARLFGSPEAVSHCCDTCSPDKRNLKDILHARNGAGCVRVETLDLCSENGRMGDERDFHSGKVKIEAEFLRAITLCATIKPSYFVAGQAKIAVLLQRDILREREASRGVSQLR